jgi:hypothetical protein
VTIGTLQSVLPTVSQHVTNTTLAAPVLKGNLTCPRLSRVTQSIVVDASLPLCRSHRAVCPQATWEGPAYAALIPAGSCIGIGTHSFRAPFAGRFGIELETRYCNLARRCLAGVEREHRTQSVGAARASGLPPSGDSPEFQRTAQFAKQFTFALPCSSRGNQSRDGNSKPGKQPRQVKRAPKIAVGNDEVEEKDDDG